MTNIIAFPRLQADTCRLHNRYWEMRAVPEPEPEPVRSFPTPFGWFLIGLAIIARR